MVQSTNDNSPLNGVTVLVVEDDFLLAMDLEASLVGMGAVTVDVCHSLDEAMTRADENEFAVAVLDFNLGADPVTPLAHRLSRQNVPFILHTGMSPSEPSLIEWMDHPIIEKPASPSILLAAIQSVLSHERAARHGPR